MNIAKAILEDLPIGLDISIWKCNANFGFPLYKDIKSPSINLKIDDLFILIEDYAFVKDKNKSYWVQTDITNNFVIINEDGMFTKIC